MIAIERQGAVAVLTLNRPERRNALGTASMQALAEALRTADGDAEIGAIVLAGAAPAFCAGSDLKELGGLSIDAMCAHEAETAAIARSIGLLAKPVISAVEGYALGGGFILAISCDIVVTAANARWHLPEVGNGWLPPWGLQALVARVGPVKARQLTWGASAIDGAEAHRLGVADEIAETGGALALAVARAATLAALPAAAVASTKAYYARLIGAGADVADDTASAVFASNCTTPEAIRTLAKFTVPA